MNDRAASRERVDFARNLVEESTMPERLKENARILLRAPTGRQVRVIIELAKRYPPKAKETGI